MSDERYARQLMLFGEEGQRRIENTRCAIVGIGGLGSHVVQQLAYLGVRNFRLIDGDIVDTTNLNRLVNAVTVDAKCSAKKVDVAERFIRTLHCDTETSVDTLDSSFISDEAFDLIVGADVVFGCLDKDGARLILNELCQAFELPYFDLATAVDPKRPLEFGGRVLYSVNGERCVYCADLLDQEQIRHDLSSEQALEEDARIYNIPRSALGNSGPAVVSLNGIVASLAVTEFIVDKTELRTAHRLLTYRGDLGIVKRNTDPPSSDCPYCKPGLCRGRKEEADVRHWIRDGWGRRLR